MRRLRIVEVDDDYMKGDWVEAMFEADQEWYPGVVEDPALGQHGLCVLSS